MSDLRGLIERGEIPKDAITVLLNHMCSFGALGFGQTFPQPPATAKWEDFSSVEQAAGRLAALALLRSLDSQGVGE